MTGLRCVATFLAVVGVAAAPASSVAHGAQQVSGRKRHRTPVTTGDSPITIRGGSVVGHQGFTGDPTSFTCYQGSSPTCTGVSVTYNLGVSTIELNRTVALNSKWPFAQTTLDLTPPNTDWKIALTFRSPTGGDGASSGAELDICSKSDCTTGSSVSSVKTIYLVSPNAATGAFKTEQLETVLAHYSVAACAAAKPGAGTICDHIYKIQFTGPFVVQGSSAPPLQPQLCIDGACEITLK